MQRSTCLSDAPSESGTELCAEVHRKVDQMLVEAPACQNPGTAASGQERNMLRNEWTLGQLDTAQCSAVCGPNGENGAKLSGRRQCHTPAAGIFQQMIVGHLSPRGSKGPRTRRIAREKQVAPLLALAVVSCVVRGASSTLIEGRHKTDRQCSLKTVEGDDIPPTDYCSFLPELGENKHRRVMIQFGESNCEFTLRSCLPVIVLQGKRMQECVIIPHACGH